VPGAGRLVRGGAPDRARNGYAPGIADAAPPVAHVRSMVPRRTCLRLKAEKPAAAGAGRARRGKVDATC
jgi:hypothetical protein